MTQDEEFASEGGPPDERSDARKAAREGLVTDDRRGYRAQFRLVGSAEK